MSTFTAPVMFIPVARSIEFDGGSFDVFPNFAASANLVGMHLAGDGFVYPPEAGCAKLNGKQDAVGFRETVRWRTERCDVKPGFMHRLPASHELRLELPVGDDPRRSEAAFLVHLLAYLLGIRLQFADWWFDARVPLIGWQSISVGRDAERRFLSDAYRVWSGWSAADRHRMVATLAMHSRTPVFERPWEGFSNEYVVFDALYATTKNLRGWSHHTHRQRLTVMANEHQLVSAEHEFDAIYALRNPLVHEALWDGSQPGVDFSDRGFRCGMILRPFNQRLIAAMLGGPSHYTRTPWNDMNNDIFE